MSLSLESLPPELSISILQYSDIREIRAMSCSSSFWHKLTFNNTIWETAAKQIGITIVPDYTSSYEQFKKRAEKISSIALTLSENKERFHRLFSLAHEAMTTCNLNILHQNTINAGTLFFWKSLSMMIRQPYPVNDKQLQTAELLEDKAKEFPTWMTNKPSLLFITRLHLAFSSLLVTPPCLEHLIELTDLNLQGNSLSALPKEFGNLKKLTCLSLDANNLVSFPEELLKCTLLRKLYLSENEIDAIPDGIENLKELKIFKILKNRVSYVSPMIKELSKLETLNLNRNQIAKLPDEIGQLTNLRSLQLSRNRLKTIPSGLYQLKKLKWLCVSRNEIATLPNGIGQLNQIVEMIFSRNELISFPFAASRKLIHLKILDLSHNRLRNAREIKQAFKRTVQVKT